MSYAVGDVVKVRDDLEVGSFYGSVVFNHSRSGFRGEKVTISDRIPMKGKTLYLIEEDVEPQLWTSEMFM